MKIVNKGFKHERKTFKPPKSAADFEWPTTPTSQQKKAFAATLKKLADARGMECLELAKRITGEIVNSAGFQTARDGQSFRNFYSGKSIPREKMASVLATYFGVPLEALIGKANGHATNGHANGHAKVGAGSQIMVKGKKGGKKHKVAPASAGMPEGATAPVVKLETYPEDPRYCTVYVSGTMPIDQALSLMALMDPRHEGHQK